MSLCVPWVCSTEAATSRETQRTAKSSGLSWHRRSYWQPREKKVRSLRRDMSRWLRQSFFLAPESPSF